MRSRVEKDALGNVKVPADAYFGSETQRAMNNFQISGLHLDHDLIKNYAIIKRGAATANSRLGRLDRKKAGAIIRACDEIRHGKLWGQFTLDVFQAGAGTSTNMNVNEVVANRSIEMLGGRKGDYRKVHPNDDVNMSQSTNDTFHSAVHITAYLGLRDGLAPAIGSLAASLAGKAREYARVVKLGRTHLQDAVPMTVGEELSAPAYSMRVAGKRLGVAMAELRHLPLGGTALGTGINAPHGYREMAIREINRATGADFRPAHSIFFEMQDQTTEAMVASVLESIALEINKMANDFRLLGSGPRAGIGELVLPAVQPGSSIMPGKVNPSIAEMANMVCFQVMGSAESIRWAAGAGQLELNVFMPVIAFNLLFSMEILKNAIVTLDRKCVRGLRINERRIGDNLAGDLEIVTALSPYVGYARAAQIARRAWKEGKSVKQVCIELNILDRKTLDRVLDPGRLV